MQSILAENEKRCMYYIEWEGLDPETGEPWQPTWVSRAELSTPPAQDHDQDQALAVLPWSLPIF